MPTKTKMDFVDEIAERYGIPKSTVKMAVHQFLDEIVSELAKGNRLEFRDFGVFEIKQRAPRKAQNPKTMEPVKVPAKRVVKFKMGRRMGKKMNGEGVNKEKHLHDGNHDEVKIGEADSSFDEMKIQE
jgi:integration host factor subunit beta